MHPLLTGHTRCVPVVEIKYTGLPFVKMNMEIICTFKQIIQHVNGLNIVCYSFHSTNGTISISPSSIPISLAYVVYISQLNRYARACSTYDQFLIRGSLLINKVDVTGDCSVSFTGNFLQILPSLQRSCLPLRP
jgi:hypothetical protein